MSTLSDLERQMTAVERVARAVSPLVDELLAEHRAERAAREDAAEVDQFGLALVRGGIRSCPGPELMAVVPSRFYAPVDRVAVVTCPCDWLVVAELARWTFCEGCGRAYLWTGRELRAVRAAPAADGARGRDGEPAVSREDCRCRDFRAVPGHRPRCVVCGMVA